MTKGPHTMTKDELLELADRCEREGATFALEGDIFEAVGGPLWDDAIRRVQEPCGCPPDIAVADAKLRAPAYTTSLDAAVTLVPENASVNVGSAIMADGAVWRAVVGGGMACWAATPALARCAAALRARASLTEE